MTRVWFLVLCACNHVLTPYLASDCSRLYVSGIGSVFYAQQR